MLSEAVNKLAATRIVRNQMKSVNYEGERELYIFNRTRRIETTNKCQNSHADRILETRYDSLDIRPTPRHTRESRRREEQSQSLQLALPDG